MVNRGFDSSLVCFYCFAVDFDFRDPRPPHPSPLHRLKSFIYPPGTEPPSYRFLSAFLSSFLFLLLSLGGDRFAQPRSKKEKRFKEETFETREPLGLRSLSLSSPLLVYEPTSKLDYYPKIFLATASLFPLVYGIHPFKNFFSPLAWHDCARGFFRNPSIFLYFLFLQFSLETFVASS